jgi:hypothetical protein
MGVALHQLLSLSTQFEQSVGRLAHVSLQLDRLQRIAIMVPALPDPLGDSKGCRLD